MTLPAEIAAILEHKTGQANTIGLSGSTVIQYDDCVLKIDPISPNTEVTVATMRWLDGKVPAAKVIAHKTENGLSYLLMSRAEGEMACSDVYLSQPDLLIPALASGMHLLWRTDPTDCPRRTTVDDLLMQARFRVETGLVDIHEAEPETFGPNAFRDPLDLLQWLETNRPESDLILSHGDYCLPNIFLKNGCFHGFIDMDSFGIGEKWRDIALCYRSLKHNASGYYGGKVYSGIDPNRLFIELRIQPDWDQIRYHLLLDELF